MGREAWTPLMLQGEVLQKQGYQVQAGNNASWGTLILHMRPLQRQCAVSGSQPFFSTILFTCKALQVWKDFMFFGFFFVVPRLLCITHSHNILYFVQSSMFCFS